MSGAEIATERYTSCSLGRRWLLDVPDSLERNGLVADTDGFASRADYCTCAGQPHLHVARGRRSIAGDHDIGAEHRLLSWLEVVDINLPDKERGLNEDAGTANNLTKDGCSAAAVINDPGIANIVNGRACPGNIIYKGNPLLTRSMGGEFVPQPNGLGTHGSSIDPNLRQERDGISTGKIAAFQRFDNVLVPSNLASIVGSPARGRSGQGGGGGVVSEKLPPEKPPWARNS